MYLPLTITWDSRGGGGGDALLPLSGTDLPAATPFPSPSPYQDVTSYPSGLHISFCFSLYYVQSFPPSRLRSLSGFKIQSAYSPYTSTPSPFDFYLCSPSSPSPTPSICTPSISLASPKHGPFPTSSLLLVVAHLCCVPVG